LQIIFLEIAATLVTSPALAAGSGITAAVGGAAIAIYELAKATNNFIKPK